jgi:HSP20 family protein
MRALNEVRSGSQFALCRILRTFEKTFGEVTTMKNAIAPKQDEKKHSLTTATQFSPFASLQQEMNRLFEEVRSGWGFQHNPVFEQMGDFHAKVDMKETDKELVISAELPGVDMKDIQISLNKNSLVLRGEKKVEKEEKDKGYYRMERSFGSFYRAIPLPYEVESDNADAVYKDGVLIVTLQKCKELLKAEKQISVKAG